MRHFNDLSSARLRAITGKYACVRKDSEPAPRQRRTQAEDDDDDEEEEELWYNWLMGDAARLEDHKRTCEECLNDQ